MNSPFDFFDMVCCINLPQHVSRKANASQEFERMGISDRVIWLHAPPPPPSFKIDLHRRNPATEFGCSLSHLTTIVQAIDAGAANILIFEDDLMFLPGAASQLSLGLRELPTDWAGLYLGCNLKLDVPYSSNLRCVKDADGLYAYAVNGAYLFDLFKYWTYGITHGLVLDERFSPVDSIFASFFIKHGAYAICPPIVIPNKTIPSVIQT